MGVADDWSYISIANVFYRTGHTAYNGWASAMVGWQLYIAAFLYKLFGVAFDPQGCAGLAPFAPVSYTSWPDMRRVTLYVVRYPAPWRPESDYAVQ